MPESNSKIDFDVAIVGGGPAGLGAAVMLGRSRRRVMVFDHGQPRNAVALAVHGYLGLDGIAPAALRERGRLEAQSYGVQFHEAAVIAARCLPSIGNRLSGFEVQTSERAFISRVLLLATGLVDELPDVENIRHFYGRTVHHCPYCDGWEHRDKRLVALGSGEPVKKLAVSLRTWSTHVTACSHGAAISAKDRRLLDRKGIVCREERIARLSGKDGVLEEVEFEKGPSQPCDALFFTSDKAQRSPLPAMLGCDTDDDGLIRTGKKQSTGIDGLFLAGDADGDVQFAIVAAAEGATAAVAINQRLQQDDWAAAD